MNRIPGRAVSAVLAVGLVLLVGLLFRKSAECDRQAERITTLYGQAKALEQAAAESKHRADSLSVRISYLALHPISRFDISQLRERGLEEPVADLISDLQRHPELIPYPGVLGGRMGFNDVARMRVLSGSWVYADFDDGHVSGEAILEYQVAAGGRISWRVLESQMQ